ncbi:energy transducer TonB [Aquabacter spiritensis]|uniref:Protein TonB n=1 Tax=Aquabacter spiritensis TaxID=933073 RepID=A0A4V2UXH2_9HYPH|nr:energy transducer TonB [Aquabacter spiritensis]TCT03488.1 outer membrane transport energization protein TonB [Aquabacter spiritensis]
MTAVPWQNEPSPKGDGGILTRYLAAGAVILAVHVGAVYFALHMRPAAEPAPAAAAMMIDLAPVPVSAPSEVEDVAPGPQMMQAPEPLPDLPEDIEEATPPPEPIVEPLLELPDLPPPPPLAEALLPPPRPVETVKEPPPPLPVEKPKPKPKASRKPPAPVTSAAPRSEAPRSNATAAPSAGATSSNSTAPATWRSQLIAHINRHKRYPAEARSARHEGTARLRFSIDRSGRVVGATLVGSAGSAMLDEEVMQMIRRASPVPAPPPEVPGGVITFTVPVNFNLR